MAQAYLTAAQKQYRQLPAALQHDLNIQYSYRRLVQLSETSPTRLQNQYLDAFQKAVTSAKQQQTWQAAQRQATQLCTELAAVPHLSQQTALLAAYQTFKANYRAWPLPKLQQESQRLRHALATTLHRQALQTFDAAFAALLRFAHTTSEIRQRPPLQQIYRDLKQAVLAKDVALSQRNTALLLNLLTISVALRRPTQTVRERPLATPAPEPPVTGTPGLTLRPTAAPTSPLYFMK